MALNLTTHTTQKVELRPHLKKRLMARLETYASLEAQIAALEEARQLEKTAIEAIRAETGEANLEIDGYKVTLVTPEKRGTLSKEMLLKNGVTMDVIEQSTQFKPVASYTKVSVPKSASAKDRE